MYGEIRMKNFYKVIFTSILISTECFAGVRGSIGSDKRVASNRGGAKRRSASTSARASAGLRSSMISASATTASTTSSTTPTVEKDEAGCKQIFYTCMNDKTMEAVMQNELLYDDYNDMVSDIYSGMSQPPFRCIYSNKVKNLYSSYNYGFEISAPSGNTNAEKIKKGSIAYYSFLKDNASDVATKKLSAKLLHSEALAMANLTISPIDSENPKLAEVSYKITTLDTKKIFDENVKYCIDPKQNTDIDGCENLSKSTGRKWGEAWKEETPSVNASCKDYEVFLTEKRTKAKEQAQAYISQLSTKLFSVIEEYNLKVESDKKLKALEEQEKRKFGFFK